MWFITTAGGIPLSRTRPRIARSGSVRPETCSSTKFVCRGTLEEKIDTLIESKRRLSRDLLEGGAELLLTEMRDEELLGLVALDLKAATLEA